MRKKKNVGLECFKRNFDWLKIAGLVIVTSSLEDKAKIKSSVDTRTINLRSSTNELKPILWNIYVCM
uniref:Uncharacterized protein n=1 Tax=Meloidogyne enterolobii TaxID=390850 RepID=A0A6V7UTY3_MELEN|nr:unnamed protein product [Meloidogyne enterolobii]